MQDKKLLLSGRRAVVTGASRGIGFAIAEDFAKNGADLVIVARGAESLAEAANRLKEYGGKVHTLVGDVADPALSKTILELCTRELGGLDISVCNAGGPPMGSFLEHSFKAWDDCIATSLMSAVRFAKEFAPGMKAQGYGRLLYISSTIAMEPTAEMVLSATSRAGVSAFAKAISIELAPFGVTTNIICPGGVLTDRLKSLVAARATRESRPYETVLAESQSSIPMKVFAEPSQIADLVTFLASPKAAYITGQSHVIDGGLTKSF